MKTYAFPEHVLSQHVAFLGKTGSGKTSSAKLLVEQVVATGSRVCVLDPIKSDWWGLTSSADGKKAGLPFYILGGPKGHVPLHASAGAALGKVVASGALPHSIIDMADFGPGEHVKFFIDFAQALFRNMQGVVYLVVEEAHMFAPKQQGGYGEETKAIHWMSRIASGARSKGIRLLVCTQRTQKLHNDVLGSCDTLAAHRMTFPADQKPVKDWLAASTDKPTVEKVSKSLAGLKPGEAWLCSADTQTVDRLHFPRIKTYDNTATPTGDEQQSVRTAKVDADKLRDIIGKAIDDAKANDPKELRKQVAELQKQLRTAGATPQYDIDEERRRSREQGFRDAVETITATFGEADRRLIEIARMADHLRTDIDEKYQHVAKMKVSVNGAAKKTLPPSSAGTPTQQTARVRPNEAAGDGGDLSLGKCERAILQVLSQHDGCDSGKLALLSGYRYSGGFRNSLGSLRGAGLIEGANTGVMRITDAGMACGPFEPLPEGDGLVQYWLTHPSLGKCERAILETLVKYQPCEMTADDLCEETGYEYSGGFRNSLGKLRTAGLIVGKNTEPMRPAESLVMR